MIDASVVRRTRQPSEDLVVVRPSAADVRAEFSLPYPVAEVANWLIERGLEDGRPVDPLKLQKLLYFAHGWHLAITGAPLLDEPIEAWQYGPVVSSIYHEFKHFGSRAITHGTWVSPVAQRIDASTKTGR